MTAIDATTLKVINIAQTFFVDPGAVKNAPACRLTSVDLYFKSKPTANSNASGIQNPGVTLYVSKTATDGFDEVPDLTKVVSGSAVRLEYGSINVSNTAATATKFSFPSPILVETGKSYALLLKYDGDEAFKLWSSVEGGTLVGTTNKTAGPAGKFIGKYYEFSSTSNTASQLNSTGVGNSWKPLNTTDLKFDVYVAKYTPDSWANTTSVDPVSNATITQTLALRSYFLEKKPYEFLVYNSLSSNNTANVVGGEVIWQNNVVQTTRVSVKAGSKNVTTSNANFTTLYGNTSGDKYIVVFSGVEKNIRKVATIASNTVITVDVPFNFTNSAAQFSKVAAGKVDIISKTIAFGQREDALVIDESNANTSLRFTNNVVEAITITAGGTGYSNSDYVRFSGGGANAIANLTTNATGGIISYNITDKGYGFVRTPTTTILVANGASNSTGTGANLTPSIGMTLITEVSNAIFANCEVINIPVNRTYVGAFDLENPYGTTYKTIKHYLYYATPYGVTGVKVVAAGTGYSNSDTITFTGTGTGANANILTDSVGKIKSVKVTAGGTGYTSAPSISITTSGGSGANLTAITGLSRNVVGSGPSSAEVQFFKGVNLSDGFANTPLILSRSVEVTQSNTTITGLSGNTLSTNKSSVVELYLTSNNEYIVTDLLSNEMDVFYEKYIVNNDYENENTGNGKALSKHISKVVNFGSDRIAEDIRVFIDAYRPPNTDIKVYARIQNPNDKDSFVDKDWTLLEVKKNSGVYSAKGNLKSLVEYELGFPSSPNSSFTANGTVTTALTSSNLVGSNTSFNTQLAANDVVKVYSPLFPNNSFITVVNSVVNSTLVTLKSPVSNNGLVGSGLVVDKIAYKSQAFNDILTSNVVTYFDSNYGRQQGYNRFAVKIVFLSDNEIDVPRVDNLRTIGVTA